MSTRLPPDRCPERLALLVGANPLPNYLAAAILEPRGVVLLHTPETQEPRDRLREALAARPSGPVLDSVCIEDATDPRSVRDACSQLDVDHLHYSGGTKPMAVHAMRELRLDDRQASYLDERRGLLRFDDGFQIDLGTRDLGLSLDILLQLHGIERRTNTHIQGGPTSRDLDEIVRWALSDPGRAQTIYETFHPGEKPQSLTGAKAAPWSPAQHGLKLSVDCIPGPDWLRARYDQWVDFLTGGWLEWWTANLVRSCLDNMRPAVEVNVKCKRTKPFPAEFEIDVALVRGHRLYVISCTTERRKGLCKSKIFEVSMRARQMGGDLARSALVCLSDAGAALRADIASVWDASNVPRVFDLADLREWVGESGSLNRATLQEWLDT